MRAAAAVFNDLASRPGAKVEALIDAATAYGGLGDELGQSGTASLSDSAGALAAYQKTLEIDERILKMDPANIRVRRGLALCLMKVANIKTETDPAAALSDYDKAIAGMNALPEDVRKSLPNQRIVAVMMRKNGVALKEIGEYRLALPYFGQARAILQPFVAADPNDTRAGNDLIAALGDEAECFEDRASGVFTYEKANREEDAASALRLFSELRSRLEHLLRLEPANLDWQATLGFALIRTSLQQGARHQSGESLELAERGVRVLKHVGEQKDAQGFHLDQVATGLLIVVPQHLREPALAVKYAERIVEMSHRRKPSYLLTLASAYRANGESAQAREAAREGLALLPPSTPATVPSRVRKQLEAEAAK